MASYFDLRPEEDFVPSQRSRRYGYERPPPIELAKPLPAHVSSIYSNWAGRSIFTRTCQAHLCCFLCFLVSIPMFRMGMGRDFWNWFSMRTFSYTLAIYLAFIPVFYAYSKFFTVYNRPLPRLKAVKKLFSLRSILIMSLFGVSGFCSVGFYLGFVHADPTSVWNQISQTCTSGGQVDGLRCVELMHNFSFVTLPLVCFSLASAVLYIRSDSRIEFDSVQFPQLVVLRARLPKILARSLFHALLFCGVWGVAFMFIPTLMGDLVKGALGFLTGISFQVMPIGLWAGIARTFRLGYLVFMLAFFFELFRVIFQIFLSQVQDFFDADCPKPLDCLCSGLTDFREYQRMLAFQYLGTLADHSKHRRSLFNNPDVWQKVLQECRSVIDGLSKSLSKEVSETRERDRSYSPYQIPIVERLFGRGGRLSLAAWTELSLQQRLDKLFTDRQLVVWSIEALTAFVCKAASDEDRRGAVIDSAQFVLYSFLECIMKLKSYARAREFMSKSASDWQYLRDVTVAKDETSELETVLSNSIFRIIKLYHERIDRFSLPIDHENMLKSYVEMLRKDR